MSELIVTKLTQGGASWEVVAYDDDVSTSGQSQNIDGILPANTKLVEIDFSLQPADDSASFNIRCGNGSIDTGAYYSWSRSYADFHATPTYGDTGVASGSSLIGLSGTVGNANDEGFSGKVTIQVADGRAWCHFHCTQTTGADVGYWVNGSGIYYGNTIDRVRLYHAGATDSWNKGWYVMRALSVSGNG